MPQDKSPVDFYTLVHYFYGKVARDLGYNMNTIMLGAILYELVEPSIITYMRKDLGMNVWGHESPSNVIVDILAAYIGAIR